MQHRFESVLVAVSQSLVFSNHDLDTVRCNILLLLKMKNYEKGDLWPDPSFYFLYIINCNESAKFIFYNDKYQIRINYIMYEVMRHSLYFGYVLWTFSGHSPVSQTIHLNIVDLLIHFNSQICFLYTSSYFLNFMRFKNNPTLNLNLSADVISQRSKFCWLYIQEFWGFQRFTAFRYLFRLIYYNLMLLHVCYLVFLLMSIPHFLSQPLLYDVLISVIFWKYYNFFE